ncbi:MAG: hypothetical protein FJ388_08210 [Verrucomicrobia bacterium]|nr:hypothetical protein [Verrucomicrobiota bacterium]
MKAARADHSGVFRSVAPNLAQVPAPLHPGTFYLSEKGLTFRSVTRLAPWTEVEVEVELPAESRLRSRRIHCVGVVVGCCPATRDVGYDITLLFVEVGKRSLSELTRFSRHQARTAAQRSVPFASAGV